MLSKRKCDPPSNGGMRSPPISHGLSKRIRSGNRLISFLVALLLIVPLLLLATRLAQTSETPSSNNSSSTCEQLRLPWEGVGLLDPVDSTMLVLFASNSPDNYRYRRYMNMERGTECINSALTLRRSFEEASAAFLTDPYIASHNPFHDFFRDHNATFWEVRGNTAVPLTVDVIYTYVNPAAASFRLHHEIRGIKLSSERRYNDWEELRYSLRSLNRFALGSHSLRQYYHKLEEDTEVLQKLGLTVPNSTSLPKYLLTRVFLLLSATDQVPHWLNADAFPNLHVVTHRQLFTADNESFVLPTLNSNAIESALHRIPGLSRFFLYISNDMFVGRQLSFFDIFRPLAPPRQELHLSQLLIRNGKYERCLRDASSSRRLLFFEPILHSETGSPIAKLDPNRAEKEETREMSQQCMNEVVDSVASSIVNAGGEDAQLHALLRAADLPGWKVSPSFSFPNPHTGITAPGEGVGEDYYYYIATTKLEGITPPFGYAHCPFLMDREVMNRLNEHELFYYANATRGAYEREMYPFSPVDIYSIFSLAMTRASTRYQWKFVINYSLGLLHNNDIQLKRIAVVEQVLQEIKSVAHQWSTRGKSRSHRPQASDFGPLFGPSTSYHLQSPRLLVDLGLWWDSQVDRTSVSLSSLYNIPQVGLKIPKSEKVRWYPRLDEQLENLLHDLRHHRLFSDLTYRFEMVHSSLKAALTAARFREEKNRIPLWIGLNDNFPSASSTAEDIRRHKAAFRVLMLAATSNTGAALWEREQLEFIKLNNAPKN